MEKGYSKACCTASAGSALWRWECLREERSGTELAVGLSVNESSGGYGLTLRPAHDIAAIERTFRPVFAEQLAVTVIPARKASR
jgi:hypothetical protein